MDINALLALPQSERKRIAEKLWSSLSPAEELANEDEAVIALLDEDGQKLRGESSLLSPQQLREMIGKYRNKSK